MIAQFTCYTAGLECTRMDVLFCLKSWRDIPVWTIFINIIDYCLPSLELVLSVSWSSTARPVPPATSGVPTIPICPESVLPISFCYQPLKIQISANFTRSFLSFYIYKKKSIYVPKICLNYLALFFILPWNYLENTCTLKITLKDPRLPNSR